MKQYIKTLFVGLMLVSSLEGHDDLEKKNEKCLEAIKKLEEEVKAEIDHPARAVRLYIKCMRDNDLPLNRQYEVHQMRGELLLIAAVFGHDQVVEQLLRNGTPVDVATYFGKTALFYAVEYGHLKVAKLLLDYGADMHKRNKYNETPLQLAVQLAVRMPEFANLFQMYNPKEMNKSKRP